MLNCIIYQIKCLETGEVYIGSTTTKLNIRMKGHKSNKNSCKSKKIIERGNYKEEILLYFTCNNKKEKDRIERNFIISEPNAINYALPGRTNKEYQQDNREKLKKYKKDNKKYLDIASKIWRNNNKEKIAKYGKKWKADNKERILEQRRRKQALKPTKEENKISRIWRNTWGGDPRQHNNLLKIDVFNL